MLGLNPKIGDKVKCNFGISTGDIGTIINFDGNNSKGDRLVYVKLPKRTENVRFSEFWLEPNKKSLMDLVIL